MANQARVCLVGPSGAGKSTSARLMQCLVPNSVILSVAQPLRDGAEKMYQLLGRPLLRESERQDGKLLQEVRQILLEREPEILQRYFLASLLRNESSPLVINDDCRQGAQATLQNEGFVFVYVRSARQFIRSDYSRPTGSSDPHDAIVLEDVCSFTLDNTGSVVDLMSEVNELIFKILPEAGLS